MAILVFLLVSQGLAYVLIGDKKNIYTHLGSLDTFLPFDTLEVHESKHYTNPIG